MRTALLLRRDFFFPAHTRLQIAILSCARMRGGLLGALNRFVSCSFDVALRHWLELADAVLGCGAFVHEVSHLYRLAFFLGLLLAQSVPRLQ